MSGTSLDGVDGVVVQFSQDGALQVLAHASSPMPPNVRDELLRLNSRQGQDELHRAALAGNAMALLYAQVVQQLLQATGLAPHAITAIGAHGQTVRHQPGAHDGVGYTLQLLNPALLAERTGITVVADLRSRDVAAGGQGAPLVPAFHQQVFAPPAGDWGLVLNIGGIANVSVLPPPDQPAPVRGWDCGPGNALMDAWCQRHTGQPFDQDGRWAASGHVLPALLAQLLREPFLQQAPPKSTGRDLFHWAWLEQQLCAFGDAAAADVQPHRFYRPGLRRQRAPVQRWCAHPAGVRRRGLECVFDGPAAATPAAAAGGLDRCAWFAAPAGRGRSLCLACPPVLAGPGGQFARRHRSPRAAHSWGHLPGIKKELFALIFKGFQV